MNWHLPGLGLIGLLAVSCSSIQPLKPRALTDLTLRNGISPRVEAELRMHNPNRIGATLLPSQLEFRLEGVTLGSIHLERSRLAARSDFSIPLHAEVTYADLVSSVPAVAVSLLTDRRLTVEVRGQVRLRKFIFTRRYDLQLRQDLRLRDLRLR